MRYLILVSGMILGLVTAATATTYVVRPDGTGDFPTIQAAIDAVVDGDVIELTDGVFRGEGNRDIRYWQKLITVRSQSGNPYDCVIDCEGTPADPHRGFEFHGEDPGTALEGVTVTNGYSYDFGGAVYLAVASPTIRNCVFWRNTASGGGAIDCELYSAPIIVECTFWENSAPWGGAMCI